MDERMLIQSFIAYQAAYMDGLSAGIGDISLQRRVYEDAARNTLKVVSQFLKSKLRDESASIKDAQDFVNSLKSIISKF